jgi:hypothetical protein
MDSGALSVAGHLVNITKHHIDNGMCQASTHGVPLVRWIEIVSGQCVYGTLGAVSWLFGLAKLSSRLTHRVPIDPIMALCATAPGHHKLPERLCRWSCANISLKLVYGSRFI